MRRFASTMLCAALGAGIGLMARSVPAGAFVATVGNGLTTTDLTAPGMTPAAMASALVGAGVTVSNASFTGNAVQGGTVHLADPAVVSFNDGVILSSGNVADVLGPNKSESTTTDVSGPADPSLDTLIQNTQTVVPATYDAASLEFDFVPMTDHVYFTYVFGSDEYLEWVNLYNDVFGFFVNGQNCATTPLGQPVSIDTINSNVESNLYRDNSFWNPPANPINIESDGLTVEMICSAPVNAGHTNHMKLAIADTSDHILDSVVMLKAQSLSVVPPESCNNGSDDDGDSSVDMDDSNCQVTTTPAPATMPGVGQAYSAPPFTGSEGIPVVLDAAALGWSATPDTATTTWEVTGINGTVGTCTITPSEPQPVGLGGAIAVVHAMCPNEGEYVAHVWGWEAGGGTSNSKGNGGGGSAGSSFDFDVDFFVHNAPPAVSIDTPAFDTQVDLGQIVTLSALVNDAGVDDSATCDIDWGDGTSDPGVLSAGVCTAEHVYAAAGPVIVAVTATDGAGATGAAATLVTVNAGGVAPAVTLDPASTSVPTGTGYSFTADATGDPVPSVQWQRSNDGGTTWNDVTGETTTTLAGTATLADSGAQFQAVFSNAAGVVTTAPATLTVTGRELQVAASSAVVLPGAGVTLTATVLDGTVASGSIGGTVRFYDGTTLLGTKKFVSGATASITTKKLALGTHTITAEFRATPAAAPLVSAATSVEVSKAPTTVALTVSPAKGTVTKVFALKTKVSVAAPAKGTVTSGTVSYFDGFTLLGTAPVSATGTATYATTLPVGAHAITAVYQGNASCDASPVSNLKTITVK